VVAVGPDPSATADGPVHGAGEPNGEPLDAARQCRVRVRFAEEMYVVALYTVVHDAEAAT
jgi:hypothetical protein